MALTARARALLLRLPQQASALQASAAASLQPACCPQALQVRAMWFLGATARRPRTPCIKPTHAAADAQAAAAAAAPRPAWACSAALQAAAGPSGRWFAADAKGSGDGQPDAGAAAAASGSGSSSDEDAGAQQAAAGGDAGAEQLQAQLAKAQEEVRAVVAMENARRCRQRQRGFAVCSLQHPHSCCCSSRVTMCSRTLHAAGCASLPLLLLHCAGRGVQGQVAAQPRGDAKPDCAASAREGDTADVRGAGRQAMAARAC